MNTTFSPARESSATFVRFATNRDRPLVASTEALAAALDEPVLVAPACAPLTVTPTPQTLARTALAARPKWANRDYREAYMEAAVDQGVAWQIRINRTRRGLSQAQLAQAIGSRQSAVSRLEDPEYGAHSLDTLLTLAKAFDCALMVKFVPYSTLAGDSEHLSEDDQFARPYTEEAADSAPLATPEPQD